MGLLGPTDGCVSVEVGKTSKEVRQEEGPFKPELLLI